MTLTAPGPSRKIIGKVSSLKVTLSVPVFVNRNSKSTFGTAGRVVKLDASSTRGGKQFPVTGIGKTDVRLERSGFREGDLLEKAENGEREELAHEVGSCHIESDRSDTARPGEESQAVSVFD